MGNQLTGNFEAVLQISVRQLNAILATVHQNRSLRQELPDYKLPTFPYTEVFSIGTHGETIDPHLLRTATWLQKRRAELSPEAREKGDYSSLLSDLPQGAAAELLDDILRLQTAFAATATGSMASGKVEAQFSAPKLVLPANTTTEMMVSLFVRARYLADTPTHLLPEYIHGEVRIYYQVSRDGNRLKIRPPAEDSKISFISEKQLAQVVDAAINVEVRKLVRDRFRPNTYDLGGDFSFAGFKALGSGDSQALAVPLELPNGSFSGVASSIPANLLGGQDFALAVSSEYVSAQFEPVFERIRQYSSTFVIEIDVLPDATVDFSILSAALVWSQDVVELVITARAVVRHFVADIAEALGIADPNINIKIRQGMLLNLVSGKVVLSAPQDRFHLDIISIARAKAEPIALDAVRSALAPAQQAITATFQNDRDSQGRPGALLRFGIALRKFDKQLTGNYTKVEVNPNGLILRGRVSTIGKRSKPVAHLRSADGGDSFTALYSWIPGGRIEKIIWGMNEKVPFRDAVAGTGLLWTVPWATLPRFPDSVAEHFMFPNAWTLPRSTAVCMTIEGSQRDLRGALEEVSGHDYIRGGCLPILKVPTFILPNWKSVVIPQIWPDYTNELPINQRIFAHFDALADESEGHEMGSNQLIHVVDWDAEQPLQGIHEALARVKSGQFSLTLTIVVPPGSLNLHRIELEQRLGFSGALERVGRKESETSLNLEITEDFGHAWSDLLGVEKREAIFFIDAHRKQKWSAQGPVDPGDLAAALDEFMIPTPGPKAILPSTAVQPGQFMPNLEFEDDNGESRQLKDFLEQEVILCFFQEWSEPCRRELKRLQELQNTSEEGIVVIAFCPDEDPEAVSRTRTNLQLTCIMVHDKDRRLVRHLKIRCWPTTLYVGSEGLLDGSQFGFPMKTMVGKERKPR